MLSEFNTPNTGLWFRYSKIEPICNPEVPKGLLVLERISFLQIMNKNACTFPRVYNFKKREEEGLTAAIAVTAEASK